MFNEIKNIHFQLLYLNIIVATILLITLTISYKKIALLKKLTRNKINASDKPHNLFLSTLNEIDSDNGKVQLNRLFEKIKYYTENEKNI